MQLITYTEDMGNMKTTMFVVIFALVFISIADGRMLAGKFALMFVELSHLLFCLIKMLCVITRDKNRVGFGMHECIWG